MIKKTFGFWPSGEREARLCLNAISESPSEQPSELDLGVDRILKKPEMQDWIKSLEEKFAKAPEQLNDRDVEDMSLAKIEAADDEILVGLQKMMAVPNKYGGPEVKTGRVIDPKTGQTVEFQYQDSAEFAQMIKAFRG